MESGIHQRNISEAEIEVLSIFFQHEARGSDALF